MDQLTSGSANQFRLPSNVDTDRNGTVDFVWKCRTGLPDFRIGTGINAGASPCNLPVKWIGALWAAARQEARNSSCEVFLFRFDTKNQWIICRGVDVYDLRIVLSITNVELCPLAAGGIV